MCQTGWLIVGSGSDVYGLGQMIGFGINAFQVGWQLVTITNPGVPAGTSYRNFESPGRAELYSLS